MHTLPVNERERARPGLLELTLGSIGVVYGDIGTSPLYAFRESLNAAGPDGLNAGMIYGILSLIVWALIVVVTLKYVVLLLRADNGGEGGILSLMALARTKAGRYGWAMLALGMTGAAMFYGDAIITPAISVLSAVEGLKLVLPEMHEFIIPLSLLILTGLFAFQRYGTAKIAWIFGPVMGVWFVVLALGGIGAIRSNPLVLAAVNPYYALAFLMHHGRLGFIALGGVFLAVTGAEALYADLGHFGRRPIRLAWGWCVMPALLLNYFGQAALVLAHPEAAADPFYLLYPGWALLPMVALSTVATVIASQAVITGAYSVTHQAIQLGLLPRFTIRYTSAENAGQIYIPQVNWLLLGGVVFLIAMFRNSSNLASAYGIAVTGTMVMTDLLALSVIRRIWQWSVTVTVVVMLPLLCIDILFLSANLTKVLEGGFIPLLIAGLLLLMMRIWVRGTDLLQKQLHNRRHTMDWLARQLAESPPARVPGTAIYLNNDPDYAPSALLQNLKHCHVLHERNLLLNLVFASEPYAEDAGRVAMKPVDGAFTQVTIRFGYMEFPNIPRALAALENQGLELGRKSTSFFISRRHILASAKFGMPLWQDRIFIAMANNAGDPAEYFSLPRSQVIEMGVQLKV